MERSFQIESLRLKNFRLFSSLELNFHSNLTVLTAENGGGKTTILDAISKAVAPMVSQFEGIAPYTDLYQTDIRKVLSEKKSSMEPQFPASIQLITTEGNYSHLAIADRPPEALLSLQNQVISLHDVALGLRTEVGLYAAGKQSEMPVLPCISYYGTERLWGARDFELAAKDNEDEDPSRLYGYRNCLIPTSGFLLFSRWYRNQSFAAWQEATSGDPGQSYHPGLAIKAVNTAVLSMLEQQGWVDMRWSTSPKGLMLKHATKGWFPIGHTSDGITNIVGMVADIAYRCVRLNPEFNDQAPQKTPGIVLIDEVDMHLHPSWQQNIIGSLQKAFPLIQFIVTTHSPNVLSTVQAESIRMLSITPEGSGQAITPDRQTQGVESASVLAQVMGVDPIPNLQIAKDLSTYTALIQQGLGASDEAKGLRRVLDEHFGLDHPSMQTCDRLLRYQAFKVRLENKGTR